MESIDQLAAEVAKRLQRRGFVHEDPVAYRAGVDDAVRAIRLAAREVGLGEPGLAGAGDAGARSTQVA